MNAKDAERLRYPDGKIIPLGDHLARINALQQQIAELEGKVALLSADVKFWFDAGRAYEASERGDTGESWEEVKKRLALTSPSTIAQEGQR